MYLDTVAHPSGAVQHRHTPELKSQGVDLQTARYCSIDYQCDRSHTKPNEVHDSNANCHACQCCLGRQTREKDKLSYLDGYSTELEEGRSVLPDQASFNIYSFYIRLQLPDIAR